jgi:hypothetical protein
MAAAYKGFRRRSVTVSGEIVTAEMVGVMPSATETSSGLLTVVIFGCDLDDKRCNGTDGLGSTDALGFCAAIGNVFPKKRDSNNRQSLIALLSPEFLSGEFAARQGSAFGLAERRTRPLDCCN